MAGLAGLGLTPAARAEIVTLSASRHNTLVQDSSGALGAGGKQTFFAGVTNQAAGTNRRRGLLAFDIAGAIPAGATITSVSLTLTVDRAGNGSTSTFELHRVLSEWGRGTSSAGNQGGGGGAATSGDATWTSRFFGSGTNWQNPGGDFAAAISAARSVGAVGTYTWASTTTLVSDVQGWLDTPRNNFGWLLKNNEASARSVKRFSGEDWPDAGQRPALVIQYTVPGPGMVAMAGVCGLVALRRRRAG